MCSYFVYIHHFLGAHKHKFIVGRQVGRHEAVMCTLLYTLNTLINLPALLETKVNILKIKITRRTAGTKGFYFLTTFIQYFGTFSNK